MKKHDKCNSLLNLICFPADELLIIASQIGTGDNFISFVVHIKSVNLETNEPNFKWTHVCIHEMWMYKCLSTSLNAITGCRYIMITKTTIKAVARMLIGEGGGVIFIYSCSPDIFLMELVQRQLINSKTTIK
jgi:hypothetical protein